MQIPAQMRRTLATVWPCSKIAAAELFASGHASRPDSQQLQQLNYWPGCGRHIRQHDWHVHVNILLSTKHSTAENITSRHTLLLEHNLIQCRFPTVTGRMVTFLHRRVNFQECSDSKIHWHRWCCQQQVHKANMWFEWIHIRKHRDKNKNSFYSIYVLYLSTLHKLNTVKCLYEPP